MIYLITNRKLIPDGNIFRVVEESVNAGIDAVILREKDLGYDELYSMAKKIKSITDKKNIPLIINNNLCVAKDLQCHGFHIGFNLINDSLPKFNGITGISVHSVKEAVAAQNLGADYILAGHIFSTDCKKDLKPRGLKFIEEIKKNIDIPVIAIGGITKYNIKSVYEAGANGTAIMSNIMKSNNILKTVKELQKIP
ncbi:thiamine phosphate synthase [Tepidibacter formicigenes]|jgi:thiamine-phosphate pyrophosphorylase|uniref:Thiamine-phosphate synthase n=1 Tax=Tepidibacter formicigenes DSM 15518 TaxID=1123349 RepID=A0A1M6KPV5_9FIRM|nr:thiamine phosphate synthase [Tepidibacter formicigenes]SHJ60904.1 thiamine-phosphate pyrophosphorylase [Tepidibacter formicigenes DSM 15518]